MVSEISRAVLLSAGTMRAAASSVIRVCGPDVEMASDPGASGTATAKQRTPTSCSPSSTAYPCLRITSRCASSRSGSVMVAGV